MPFDPFDPLGIGYRTPYNTQKQRERERNTTRVTDTVYGSRPSSGATSYVTEGGGGYYSDRSREKNRGGNYTSYVTPRPESEWTDPYTASREKNRPGDVEVVTPVTPRPEDEWTDPGDAGREKDSKPGMQKVRPQDPEDLDFGQYDERDSYLRNLLEEQYNRVMDSRGRLRGYQQIAGSALPADQLFEGRNLAQGGGPQGLGAMINRQLQTGAYQQFQMGEQAAIGQGNQALGNLIGFEQNVSNRDIQLRTLQQQWDIVRKQIEFYESEGDKDRAAALRNQFLAGLAGILGGAAQAGAAAIGSGGLA